MSTEAEAGRPALEQPLESLRGVGPARARALRRLGLETLRDLVLHVPRRLESSGRAATLPELLESDGEEVLVFSGRVEARRFSRFGRRSSLRLRVSDGEREVEIVYFNQPWQRESFERGATYTFAGRLGSSERGPLVVAPRWAEGEGSLPTDRWEPVYARVGGIGPELMRSLLRLALERVADELVEPLPAATLERLDLSPLREALGELHRPSSPAAFARARRRVLLEELLPLQARVLARRSGGDGAGGGALAVRIAAKVRRELVGALPFSLTAGQRGVLAELEADLARSHPMRRLLQGDVGAGKTVLALLACAGVARAGAQCAFMAPTELLAEQHHFGARDWLARAGVRAELLTGSLRGAERRRVLAEVAAGRVDVLFGTQALLSPELRFPRLALAVVDEQQRFGVAQRARLLEQGEAAHLLLMTATPIPRTLALTIYGDLEVSLLREKPPGRGALRTRWIRPADRARLRPFLLERLEAGEQVYWVSPRIEDEGAGGAERSYARMRRSPLAVHGVGLVHGRLAAPERQARLEAFRRGETRVLVATTVIEVGVDVPRATVMVIDGAERLGLAQLHQLRGRVGRGAADSWCLLRGAESARERLELLERCDDGFQLAEEDLARRGMGELAGRAQSGELGGLLGTLGGDVDLLLAARDLLAGDAALRERLAGAGKTFEVTP